MQIRPISIADLENMREIDATIESSQYLHLDRSGGGLSVTWKVEPRALREKLIDSNVLDDERRFTFKQIITGTEDGLALVAEHDDVMVGMLIAQKQPWAKTFRLVDVRIDYDHRRQGLGLAMVFQLIQAARDARLRAVYAETKANNFPAGQFLSKCGFDLAGIDTQRESNHDLVKESATLIWYASLD